MSIQIYITTSYVEKKHKSSVKKKKKINLFISIYLFLII